MERSLTPVSERVGIVGGRKQGKCTAIIASHNMLNSGRQHSLKCAKYKRCRPVCTVVQQEEVESIPASSYGCTMVHCVFRGLKTKMPPIQSKLGAKTLHSQTREVVNNMHSFMKSEAASGDFLIPLKKVQERVSAATKVPERTIRKIIKEGKQCEEEGTSFGTPGKVHRVPKRITDMNILNRKEFMENVIESFIITGGDSSSESDDDEDDDHNENHDDNGGDISGIESLSDD
ncbi:hypothetical protein ANN_15685 [Periplaneta americana]|uniref:Uncharacterized protein n=1 Tax=Periplaneta americana TaxID=6978 RepID=A0ABQ8SHX1_PERAM|nr:hypothetical protein ANN_15685 [Periplaneta americana]